MKSCFDIVPYFLRVSSRGARGGMTPLKLQKLLYYSQAWYLVFKNKPLFQEKIEAWVHGPVVPSVYHSFKHLRYSEITDKNLIDENHIIDEEEKLILNLVWKVYGNQEAKFLEYLSHSEYPWANARQGLDEDQLSSRTISLNDMKQYYSQFVSSLHPPKIHPNALDIAPQSRHSERMQNIFSGIGSVLNIFPNYQENSDYYLTDDFADEFSDCESLESDWENIGSDFLSIIDSAKNHKKTKDDHFF